MLDPRWTVPADLTIQVSASADDVLRRRCPCRGSLLDDGLAGDCRPPPTPGRHHRRDSRRRPSPRRRGGCGRRLVQSEHGGASRAGDRRRRRAATGDLDPGGADGAILDEVGVFDRLSGRRARPTSPSPMMGGAGGADRAGRGARAGAGSGLGSAAGDRGQRRSRELAPRRPGLARRRSGRCGSREVGGLQRRGRRSSCASAHGLVENRAEAAPRWPAVVSLLDTGRRPLRRRRRIRNSTIASTPTTSAASTKPTAGHPRRHRRPMHCRRIRSAALPARAAPG